VLCQKLYTRCPSCVHIPTSIATPWFCIEASQKPSRSPGQRGLMQVQLQAYGCSSSPIRAYGASGWGGGRPQQTDQLPSEAEWSEVWKSGYEPFFNFVIAIICFLDLSGFHHHLDCCPVDGFLEACMSLLTLHPHSIFFNLIAFNSRLRCAQLQHVKLP
jgi:hypothetical protein